MGLNPFVLDILAWIVFWLAGLLAGARLVVPAVAFLRSPAAGGMQRAQVFAAGWRLAALAALVGLAVAWSPQYLWPFWLALGLETAVSLSRWRRSSSP